MTELEDAVRSALRSLPEPEMRIPAGFSDEMRHRYQRRRWYAPVAVACVVAAVAFTAVLWQTQTDTSSPIPPAVTPTPATLAPAPATRSPRPPPAVIPDQQLRETTMPDWGKEAGGGDMVEWLGLPRAFTVAGSPAFVVGKSVPGPATRNDPTMSKNPEAEVEFERTEAQVDMSIEKGSPPPWALPSGIRITPSPQQNPFYGCGTGSGGISGKFALTSPPVMQLRCWPTFQENIWVWPQLPANVTTLAYVLDGQIVARSTTLDGTGAIRIPRPASAAADQGQLEALTAIGDVIARAKLPWMS